MKERVYAFERILNLDVVQEKQEVNISNIVPNTYFEYNYGVIKEGTPEHIRIRAFWPQNAYLNDVPLHHSQVVVDDQEEYSDFELFLSPTFDFMQALLSHREMIAVLEPESLKEEMMTILNKMLAHYHCKS